MGRFFLTVMAGAAELERGLVIERTTTAMAHKKALGQRVGDIPYGYQLADDGKTLQAHDGEQALIDAVRSARNRGLSQRAIVTELTRQGFTTRKNTQLGLTQIQRIMKTYQIA
jgi:DNA invertase Pin-like site-specific DNA recombinase